MLRSLRRTLDARFRRLSCQVEVGPFLDRADAAGAIDRWERYRDEFAKNGELKFIRIAGRTLVPRSELERLTRV